MFGEEPLISPADLEAVAAKCWRSPVEFARIVLPNWFPTKMPWVHRGILALLTGRTEFLLDFGLEQWRDEAASWTPEDLRKILANFVEEYDKDPLTQKPQLRPLFELREVDGHPTVVSLAKPNIGLIMPRGFSKTTIVNLANLIDLCYKNEDFFLYASETSAHAERQLGTIKKELEENQILRMIFGDLVAARQSSNKWTDNYIEPTNGVQVGAVGRGGQIRGFSKGARRPGKITYDDLEDSESVASETQRKKDANWFFQTALPTVRRGGRSIIIGTLLHTDAILNKVMLDPRFSVVRFGAIDRQGEALWPWMMDLAAIEDLKTAMTSVGETAGFYLEYMSEYRVDAARMFPLEKLVYVAKGLEVFVGISEVVDPAISESGNADYCAFAVAGIEAGGHKHILDYYGERGMDPAAQVDKYFELHFRWMKHLDISCQRHGVEAVAYQRALIHLIKGEQFRRSRLHGQAAYFEITPILHGRTGKEARVQGILKPLLHAGYLSFQQRWPDLETQFVDWPTAKKDGPDVCAMAIGLLDPFAVLNLGDAVADLSADSAEPLWKVLGDYRKAP